MVHDRFTTNGYALPVPHSYTESQNGLVSQSNLYKNIFTLVLYEVVIEISTALHSVCICIYKQQTQQSVSVSAVQRYTCLYPLPSGGGASDERLLRRSYFGIFLNFCNFFFVSLVFSLFIVIVEKLNLEPFAKQSQ